MLGDCPPRASRHEGCWHQSRPHLADDVLAEELGGRQQGTPGRPAEVDHALRSAVTDLQVADRPDDASRRARAGRGDDRDAQARGHEPPDAGQVVAFEHDPRAEAGPRAEFLGEPPQPGGGAEADERVGGHVREADAGLPGEPVVARDGQAERVDHDPPRLHRLRVAGREHPGADLQVRGAPGQGAYRQLVGHLCQMKSDRRVAGAEAPHQIRYQPYAERLLEGEPDHARLR
jgi:hypothetical protein